MKQKNKKIKIDLKLYNEVWNFIDGVRQCTMNKQTFDEALKILKKLANEKI